jgi:AcrR family transcriptional regulator
VVTRQAILHSARQAWTEHGFDEVGLREIAGRAGVTAALVNRYFGTKEELFREAIGTEDQSPPGFRSFDREKFGALLAPLIAAGKHSALAGDDGGPDFDAIVMLLNSVSSQAAQPILRDHVESAVMPALIEYFGDDPFARQRAVLVLSLCLGIIALGPILGVGPETDADGAADPATVTLTAAMLQALADANPAG